MRKVTAFLLLAALCALPVFALCETTGFETVPNPLALPGGVWTLSDGAIWRFIIDGDAPLTLAQQATADARGIPREGETLPSGAMLSADDLAALYGNTQDTFDLPLFTPTLTQFELTGEWFYGEGDVLYYRHGDGYRTMTVDEVFDALSGQKAPQPGDKIIYLTIDDTPSPLTMDLLAVLDSLHVKATFFVVGAYAKRLPTFLRAIYDQGHAIANHSYSHDADILAGSFTGCLNDFRRTEKVVAEVLGFELSMPILRIPYGASTIPVSYRSQLQSYGYLWIDWNALNGDTESAVTTDEATLERAFSTASRYDGSIVMLVHDNKKRTIRTLPALVEHFRAEGYEFGVLTPDIGKIDGVRMGLPKD